MKKKILIVSILGLFLLPVSVLAMAPDKESTKSANLKSLTQSIKDKAGNAIETVKQAAFRKLGNSINARLMVYQKLIKRAAVLLDKLNTRVMAAKDAGVNTSNMEKLMADSNLKLASTSAMLVTVQTASSSATTKADFTLIKGEFQAMRDNLNGIRQNCAKVISQLKSYNASTSSAELRESTAEGKNKPYITKIPPPRYKTSTTSASQR